MKKTNLFKKNTLYLFLVLIVLNLFFLALFVSRYHSASQISSTSTIILTDKGFEPSIATISKNTKVTFKNTTTHEFWPASDLHPTHGIYPDFDPKRPLKPQETWSFTFTELGKWNFHDHLSPTFRGTITVVDEKGDTPILACKDTDSLAVKQQCWDSTLSSILESQGLEKGFDYLDTLFATESGFQNDCHDFAHKLGDKALTLFLEKENFTPSPKASYCGYGFYHGFMEKLLQTTKNVKQAQEFCDYVDKTLRDKTVDAGGACMHGIGHGSVEDTPDPALWSKPQAIIDRGLEQCELIIRNTTERFRCTTGVYNAYEILATSKKYGLFHDESDPFKICRTQKEQYKEGCYTQLSVAALNIAEHDYDKAMEFVDTISENTYALPTALAIIVERPKENETHSIPITFCRSLPSRFHGACIQGYAEGFLKYGPPQEEYKKALGFCGSKLLTDEEKKICYNHDLSLFRLWYTKEKARDICLSVPVEYQYNKCRYE